MKLILALVLTAQLHNCMPTAPDPVVPASPPPNNPDAPVQVMGSGSVSAPAAPANAAGGGTVSPPPAPPAVMGSGVVTPLSGLWLGNGQYDYFYDRAGEQNGKPRFTGRFGSFVEWTGSQWQAQLTAYSGGPPTFWASSQDVDFPWDVTDWIGISITEEMPAAPAAPTAVQTSGIPAAPAAPSPVQP